MARSLQTLTLSAIPSETLQALERIDPCKAEIVELKFFGGLSVEETAEALKISPQTVMRDWKMARAWLMTALTH